MAIIKTDVTVIGAGVCGLSAATALADAGIDVRVVEVGIPGGRQSAGLARIYRVSHNEPALTELAFESKIGWRSWERRLGRRLVGDEGCLVIGKDYLADTATLERIGSRFQMLQPIAQSDVLGPFAPVDSPALFDQEGGAIRVRRTVEALSSWLGDRLITANVFSIEPQGTGHAVITSVGTIHTNKVLVCAGANTSSIGSRLGIDIPIQPYLHTRAVFRVKNPSARLATLIDTSGEYGEDVYALPLGRTGTYGVGLFTPEADDVPMTDGGLPVGSAQILDSVLERILGYVRVGLPGLNPEPVAILHCVATLPGWGHEGFRAWNVDGVTLFAGHNLFKFAPLLGELLASTVIHDRVEARLSGTNGPVWAS